MISDFYFRHFVIDLTIHSVTELQAQDLSPEHEACGAADDEENILKSVMTRCDPSPVSGLSRHNAISGAIFEFSPLKSLPVTKALTADFSEKNVLVFYLLMKKTIIKKPDLVNDILDFIKRLNLWTRYRSMIKKS